MKTTFLSRSRCLFARAYFCRFTLLLIGMAVTQAPGQTIETIYDNTSRDPLPTGEGHYYLPVSIEDAFAQPINVGNNTAITSLTLLLDRLNEVSGSINLSLWSETSREPGQQLGEFGAIDVGLLPNNGLGSPALQPIVLNEPVAGLTPNEIYFVVLNLEGLQGVDRSPRAPTTSMNSIILPLPTGAEGTNRLGPR